MPIETVTCEVLIHRLDAGLAELHVIIRGLPDDPIRIIRGRFLGPRCPGKDTIEQAFPLKLISTTPEAITGRVLIPEPNYAVESQPFAYHGRIECLHGGVIVQTWTPIVQFRESSS